MPLQRLMRLFKNVKAFYLIRQGVLKIRLDVFRGNPRVK